MLKNILKSLTLLTLFFMLTAQQGCQTTSSLGEKKLSPKEQVKQSMILESKTEIEKLGGTPITEDEAKYKGKLGKDKYIQALEKQLAELKAQKEKEAAEAKAKEEKEKADAKAKEEKEKAEKAKKEEEAKKKAEKAKKEKDRAAAIQAVKKEILFLGETPMPEYEFTSEDKYIAALRKQIDEIKKLKEEEELKINAEIPDWYQNFPQGSETIMYARGSAISADLDNSEQVAIENALIKLAANLKNRINSKMDKVIKEAGVDADLTLKTEIQRISTIVVKEASVTGYKVYKTKMAPLANGKYRTFILIEFPVSLAYKQQLKTLEQSTSVSADIEKIKNTEAFKELEQYVSEFTGA
tara:strand:+ start:173 stop:1234 length:1062 start_codon:yes stop_codon:yes gene_type:complete